MEKFNFSTRTLLGINGLLITLFGIIALLFPRITLITITVFFAVFILLGGAFLVIGSLKSKRENTNWLLLLAEGIVGILLGLIILSNPEAAAAIFVTLLGIWAILIGTLFIISYFRRRSPYYRKVFRLVIGILSLVFGVLIGFNPFKGSRAIIALIGLYAIAYGIFSIINNSKLYRKQ